MEAAAVPKGQGWTFAQRGIVALAAVQLVWALAGSIAEPSIDFGEDAVTERVLHVAAGTLFLVVAPVQIGIDRRSG